MDLVTSLALIVALAIVVYQAYKYRYFMETQVKQELANIRELVYTNIGELRGDLNSLFTERPTGLEDVVLNLKRTDSYLGWYKSSATPSNEYFSVEADPIMVRFKVARIRVKKDCVLTLDTNANIVVNGFDWELPRRNFRMKHGDNVVLYGKEEETQVKIGIYKIPYLEG